jgi:hypothetical protein
MTLHPTNENKALDMTSKLGMQHENPKDCDMFQLLN